MAITAGLSRPLAQTVSTITNPKIYNVTCTLADTEYSLSLSADTKQFIIKARGQATIKIAFVSGDTDTLYVTIPPNAVYGESGVIFNGTVYLQSNKPNQVVEVLEWT